MGHGWSGEVQRPPSSFTRSHVTAQTQFTQFFLISLPLVFLLFFFTVFFTCNSAFEQGHLEPWRYINAFIIIILLSSSQFCHGQENKILVLFPGGTISGVFLPTYSWSRLFTCPNHLSLAFLHLSVIFSTFSLSLML